MKKILAFLLALTMVFSLCACGSTNESKIEENKNIFECNCLNEILNNGYELGGMSTYDNLYIQTVINGDDEEYKVVVKVKNEQRNAFDEIDFLEDDAKEKYLALLGDEEYLDILDVSAFMPSDDMLKIYTGMTIAEFENMGTYITGYSGIDGKYIFDFSDDMCDYVVELENTNLKEYDEIEEFENAILNEKIKSVSCYSLSSVFLDNYLQQFFDEPEKASPKFMGEEKSNLDEINKIVGSNIKRVSNAQEETYSVIDGKIAQYIYKVDDIYYCVRASKDMQIDLADDDFVYDSIADENGYTTLSFMQSDYIKSVRFVFNDYQYAYIVYDNDILDYETFNRQQEEYRFSIYEYEKDSVLNKVLGTYICDNEYMMSVMPISSDAVQFSVANYNGTHTKLYTMIATYSNNKFIYDKSRVEEYSNENYKTNNASGGVITLKEDTLIWENITFEKAN